MVNEWTSSSEDDDDDGNNDGDCNDNDEIKRYVRQWYRVRGEAVCGLPLVIYFFGRCFFTSGGINLRYDLDTSQPEE